MEKNKYEEALHYFESYIGVTDNPVTNNLVEEYADILNELINKETPMKPDNIMTISNRTFEICPVCGVSVYFDDHDYYLERCECCGQKIDWSDDEK